MLIEATIAEVTLSDTYQAGVDWSRLSFGGGGFTLRSRCLTGIVGSGPPPAGCRSATPTTPPAPGRRNSATRQAAGAVRQHAGSVQPEADGAEQSDGVAQGGRQHRLLHRYKSSISQGTQAVTNICIRSPRHRNTVAVGLILSMTPQINENGVVTLTVRPTDYACARHRARSESRSYAQLLTALPLATPLSN